MQEIKVESFGIIPLAKVDDVWIVCLVLHKEGSHWGFPKGRKNPGETHQQAAARELKEETGLEVTKYLQDLPLIEHYQFRKQYQLVDKTVYYFPAFVSGQLKLQEEEIREGRWVRLDEALELLSFKEGRSILQKLMKIL